ncbi:hypothetical protein TNCT_240771 [Trichonephila clavata]|uniref:Uncharacterized protein n=1 Tax=Trichonephila clavata TaxID=2740835 RepID=A0A8X6M4Q4_TRICU|nr:hypothetical protein TNCT_240771 [Trichonephila clavata]
MRQDETNLKILIDPIEIRVNRGNTATQFQYLIETQILVIYRLIIIRLTCVTDRGPLIIATMEVAEKNTKGTAKQLLKRHSKAMRICQIQIWDILVIDASGLVSRTKEE